MGNPDAAEKFLDLLSDLVKERPHLRIGQVMASLVHIQSSGPTSISDLFFMEDKKLVELLSFYSNFPVGSERSMAGAWKQQQDARTKDDGS